MKVCYTCKQEKTLDSFNRDKYSKDGLQGRCKKCNKEWYSKNKDKHLQNLKKHYIINKSKRKEQYNSKKDGLHLVYLLKNEHYVGITENGLYDFRMANHKCNGKNINNVKILFSSFNRKKAKGIEDKFHKLGFFGEKQELKNGTTND